MKHILIDFENVHPEAEQLNALDESCHIWLFLGKLQQKTLSLELCEALCRFGKNVHFVRVAKTGKNALDFYLAYYLGKITTQDSEAIICILSRDGGFDVLVEHLEDSEQCKGILRLASLEEAGQNDSELLESKKNTEMPSEHLTVQQNDVLEQKQESETVEPYKNTTFIGECAKKVVLELMKPNAFKPSVIGNLQNRLRLLLADELQAFTDEQQMVSVSLIIQKLKEKQWITQNPETQFLEYHVSNEDVLERLIQKLIQSKTKSIDGARNVLISQAKILYIEINDETVRDILKYCEQEEKLRIKDKKIEYPPFGLTVPVEQQEIITNQKDDAAIMQAVTTFFNKCAKNKPKNKKALVNSFKSILKLSGTQIEKLIQTLIQKKKLTISETGKITYK